MPHAKHPTSRRHYRRGLLDFAYFCAHCGHIALGPPFVDPRDPPPIPHGHCKRCRRRAWHESAIPSCDPSVFDVIPNSIRSRKC